MFCEFTEYDPLKLKINYYFHLRLTITFQTSPPSWFEILFDDN